MRKRSIGLLCAAVMVTVTVGFVYAAEEAEPQEPKVLAVAFHADWCGTCEQLKEPVAEMVDRVEEEPVLFVKLDLTDEATQQQAEMLAAALGLNDVWTEYSRGTGFVLLIDRESGEVVDRLTTKHSAEDMASKVDSAIAGVAR